MSKIKSLYPFAQKWQEKGSIAIFSDPHWNDADRAFMGYNISEMEQCKKLLKNLHSGDTLICLGDVGKPDWIKYFIKKKRNHIHTVLIMGNHDKHSIVDEYFDEIYDGPIMISPKIMLSHEPVISSYWYNIHGHDHANAEVTECENHLHKNLAANVCEFELFKLNDFVNKGGIKHIDDIHRYTINNASNRKKVELNEMYF